MTTEDFNKKDFRDWIQQMVKETLQKEKDKEIEFSSVPDSLEPYCPMNPELGDFSQPEEIMDWEETQKLLKQLEDKNPSGSS